MNRDYIFHESTTSMCPECMKTVPAKIILKDNSVYIQKNCEKHGLQYEILEEDQEYHLKKREYDKPGTGTPVQTKINKGCPNDCGLCPEHDQHTCIGLIEVTLNCNLGCKTCYADSFVDKDTSHTLSMDQISKMLDFFIETEGGEAEIVQLSGGEPAIHPQIIDIIRLARTKKIRYLMLNTNGIRIAEDLDFVRQLSQFKGKFEVYLQFDGFDKKVYQHFRGKDLTGIKQKALENLAKFNIPTTLVTTIEKGINDDQLGKIIDYGIEQPNIRGINFQPVALFGRNNNIEKSTETGSIDRITLSGTIQKIVDQTDVLTKGDIVPLPCNVERVAICYLVRNKDKFNPVTKGIKEYLPLIDNTFAFDAEKIMKKTCKCMDYIKKIRLPLNFALKSRNEKIKYINENTFRISITSFVDPYNFDIKSMQKECVHVITHDLKRIPFSAYNMIHRYKTQHQK
ncbi:radical SAM protein [Candidatus Woesearchaeota archaeon]|nr:radical SAM protein [Candidatus Woesearchaeota archaeon]